MRRSSEAMWSWEFTDLLQAYLHPRWWSIGVESTIYGNQPRERMGIAPHGTIWVAGPAVHLFRGQWHETKEPRERLIAIRKGCIPAKGIQTAQWNEENLRWEKGDLTRGWVPALEYLIKSGYLRPHKNLSTLLGHDTFRHSGEYRL
jgi:hypothetical protein